MSHSTIPAILSAFLQAFSRLDLDAMLACFDQQATAFFPTEHAPTRLAGKEAIGQAFALVLAKMRARGGVPLLLHAEDLLVDDLGDTAVATFHLRGEHLSRRTIVLRRHEGTWRIIHLHASNGVVRGEAAGNNTD